MKVYIVGDHGPEHNSIKSIHKTHKGALKAWDKLRLELLEDVKSSIGKVKDISGICKKMVKSLSCKDPDKIDNYPHETPYIREYEVEE